MAVADGSFKDKRGTSAFCITTMDRSDAYYGANDVPGDFPSDHCLYRSELTGILGTLVLCRLLCQSYNITSGQLIIGCDNIAAGRHSIEFRDPPRPTDNHFDILGAIHRIQEAIPIELSFQHVEGQQREKYPSRLLDAWAKLNDRMDALAKAYWLEIIDTPRIQGRALMPAEWRAEIDGRRVCKQFSLAIRQQIESRLLERKWVSSVRRKGVIKALQFTKLQIAQIDFEVIQKVWDGVNGSRRLYVSKLSTSFFPVGSYMKRMKFWPKDNCPCCLRRNETVKHMLSECKDSRVRQHRETAVESFSQLLRRIKTDSKIRDALLGLIRHALLGESRRPEDTPPHLHETVASQLFIGVQHLLLGRISKYWALIQHKAYTHYAPWLSGSLWAQKVVKGIWDLTFSIWDHRNNILHTTDVHDELLDMDAIDLQIIEEWHAGPTGIPPLDQYLFKGLLLDVLLEKHSSLRREWLASILFARDPGDPDFEGDAAVKPFEDNPPAQSTQSTCISHHDDPGEASDSTNPDSSSSSSSEDE